MEELIKAKWFMLDQISLFSAQFANQPGLSAKTGRICGTGYAMIYSGPD